VVEDFFLLSLVFLVEVLFLLVVGVFLVSVVDFLGVVVVVFLLVVVFLEGVVVFLVVVELFLGVVDFLAGVDLVTVALGFLMLATTLAKVAWPKPVTLANSSTFLKGRDFLMKAAFSGPTPGRVWRSVVLPELSFLRSSFF